MKSTILASLVMVILSSSISIINASEKGSAFYEFLEDPINSRSIGMGAAGTALPDNRGIAYYNPALPALNSRPYLSFDFSNQYTDMNRSNPEFAWVFPLWFVGVAFQTQSYGTIQNTDIQGIIEGATQTAQSSMGSLDVGFRKKNFALGITLSGVQDKIAEYTSYGVLGSAGAVFNVIPQKLTLGAAIINFGKNSSFLDTTHALHQSETPLTIRGGVAWVDKLKDKYSYSVAADVVYSKNYQKVMVPVGVEFWLLPSFALRIGKKFNFDTDLFSIGTGLRFENLGFDAAFTPTRVVSDVGVKWSMGIIYYLPAVKKDIVKKVTAPKIDTAQAIKDSLPAKAPADTEPVFKAPIEIKLHKKSTDSITVPIDTVLKPLPPNQRNTPSDSSAAVAPQRTTTADSSAKAIGIKDASKSQIGSDTLTTLKKDPAVSPSGSEKKIVIPEAKTDSIVIINTDKVK